MLAGMALAGADSQAPSQPQSQPAESAIEYTPEYTPTPAGAGISADQEDAASRLQGKRQLLTDAARETYTARALLVALLMAPPERFVHQQQLDMVQAEQGVERATGRVGVWCGCLRA